jgi:hypothetical protein
MVLKRRLTHDRAARLFSEMEFAVENKDAASSEPAAWA